MLLFASMLLVLASILGWLALAVYETSHRGMLSMIKKMAFEWLGGTLLGLVLMSGPILDFVLHR